MPTIPLTAAHIYIQPDNTLDIVVPLYGPGRVTSTPKTFRLGNFDLRYVPKVLAPIGDRLLLTSPPVLRIQVSGVGPDTPDFTLSAWDPDALAVAIMRGNNQRSVAFAAADVVVSPIAQDGQVYDALSFRFPCPTDVHTEWSSPFIGATVHVNYD